MNLLSAAILALVFGTTPCQAYSGAKEVPVLYPRKLRSLAKHCALAHESTSRSSSSMVALRHLKVRGKVRFLTGQAIAGSTVWVASFRAPSQHLIEGNSDSFGSFSLEFNLSAQASDSRYFFLGAKHPTSVEAWEILELGNRESEVTILLRRSAKSLDEPDLDEVKDWVLRQLGNSSWDCLAKPSAVCDAYRSLVQEYLREPSDSPAKLEQTLLLTKQSQLIEARLLAAVMLMRLGAWMSAEKLLDQGPRSEIRLPERSFLQGVLWNFLRRPELAVSALQRTVNRLPKDGMANLELGRANILNDDALNAQIALERALDRQAPEAQVRYLLIRSLLAQNETQDAYVEAKTLTKSLGDTPLPPEAKDLLAEVLGRLGESFNVINYPVSDLIHVIPGLRGLEPNAPPPAEGLATFLREVGARTEGFFKNFTETGALEIIRQAQLGKDMKPIEQRTEKTHYIIHNESTTGHYSFHEYRADAAGRSKPVGGLAKGFMVTSNFVSILTVFLPDWQPGITFRFLGQQQVAGRRTYVIAFAQRPALSAPMVGFQRSLEGVTDRLHLQGVAWITVNEFQCLRMHTDLLYPLPDVQLTRLSGDIDYRPRQVGDSERIYWLPVGVTVRLDWSGKQLRNQHILSDYVLFKVDAHDKIQDANASTAGTQSPDQ